jgi:triphosphatase
MLGKAERGFALADDNEPNSIEAGPIALKPDLPAAEAFRMIAHACIRDFRLNEPLLLARRSAEPLHQARVALRRLRSALSLFKPIVRDQKYERLKRRLRAVSHQFGDARNLDVYIAHITTPNARGRGGLPPSPSRLPMRVQAARERAYAGIVRTLRSQLFRHLMQDLVTWVESGSWCTSDAAKRRAGREQTVEVFASRVLERSRRKLQQDGRRLDRLPPDGRHRIRIEAKKLRYASEFFSGLWTDRKHHKRYKIFAASLEDLQTCLGDLNDIQTGHEIAAGMIDGKVALAGGPEAVDAAAGQANKQNKRTGALLISACKAYERFSSAKPFWKR